MSDKTNIAVCGAGNWGKNLVKHFHELGALKAICDKRKPLVESLASVYREATLTTSFDHILADASIQAVAIAAPTLHHYSLAKQALKAGKHVFVEKPLALKVSHAEELCALARQEKRKLMVGHLLLYHPVGRYLLPIHSKA